ncbi:hypothetical protein D3C81_1537960 [compost metagenome]
MGVHTAQHFHECGFAGTVLADEAVDFTCIHFEIHIHERLDAGEFLGNIIHF